MKKTIIIILAVLPIFLLITIAFAAKLLELNNYIPVEGVAFVDRLDSKYGPDDVFVLECGETAETKIKIYPELADDKSVNYRSLDESVCTIDENGRITAVGSGSTYVEVVTVDANKSAKLNVLVKAEYPESVQLDKDTVELIIGESVQLTATVETQDAQLRDVTYESDNPEVATVDVNGKVYALSEGVATITVKTVETPSGFFTDTCVVTVTDGDLPIDFDFTGAEGINYSGTNQFGIKNYITNVSTINLMDYLRVSDEHSLDDVEIEITQNAGSCTLTDGVLTINAVSTPIKVHATVGSKSADIYIVLFNN